MAESWYALRSKPRKEEVLWQQLLARDIEVFFPRIRVHPVNPRSRKLRPYFPGYMFVQVDIEAVGLSKFNWMPFAVGLVSFDGEPATVPESLIHEVRKRVDEIAAAGGEFYDGLKPGDPLAIAVAGDRLIMRKITLDDILQESLVNHEQGKTLSHEETFQDLI